MKLQHNTILITGGSVGIGYEWADRLVEAGNTVIITGRRADKLAEAKAKQPKLHTYVNDVSKEDQRIALFEQITSEHPEVNVLINNAGVMRFLDYSKPQTETWTTTSSELHTNVEAPIHLSTLFSQYFISHSRAGTIINVTSALGHVPLVSTPVYSATKAALHSYSISLRHQLKDQAIEVIEVAPPLVDTDLGMAGANTAGLPVDTFVNEVMDALARGEQEITPGMAQQFAYATRAEQENLFKLINP